MKKPKSQKKPASDSEEEDDMNPKERMELASKMIREANAASANNSSIQTTGSVTPTIVGPIGEWRCIPENLPNHPTLAFFGKRRTGKSTTITNILYHCCGKIPFGIVMSDTAYAGYWDQLVPKRLIVQGLRQDVLDWLVARQKKLVEKYGVEDPRISAFIVLDDVIADQKTIRYNADLARFFVLGRHLAITVFIASQYVKGVGPMVRTNCDYVFLQPIYNKTQRDVLWDLEAGFMKRDEFSILMDQVIVRKNLPGNTAQTPKKEVQIMVCCDFEDSSNPQEKFYSFKPVHMKMLPKFRLCHPKYWEDEQNKQPSYFIEKGGNVLAEIRDAEKKITSTLGRV